MAEFSPIFPAHAVERCAVSLSFRPEVPEKPYQRILVNARQAFEAKGFKLGQGPTGFNINPATGQVTPMKGGPSLLVSPDGQTQIFMAPDVITIMTSQYLRWSNLKAQIEMVLRTLEPEYTALVDLFAVKLEYWDRFNWTGTWDDLDVDKLLSANQIVSAQARSAEREWHSHSGWFLYQDGSRRLVNVNVNVQGILRPGAGESPSVAIYTMMQDEAFGPSLELFEREPVSSKLDVLHEELKAILEGILLPEVSHKIGLRKGRSH
ncbi:TIGR04255 family protein [Sinorhizobium meliloti]|uniref:TIGR04255 family protein n=1 Tax=Rhizobium meliloti TaxID=382 RepID=UPI00047843F7|nr:TIGR04255 family protein [Sinorhizobium meliloti]MDE3771492.1 TIGR04255 family protein [Sinorhizobium meliloti]MDE3790537.1 TIGR04255 family protein [Sinorhizobium meliloti]MDW9568037.1 TIGR04255 family protein [Sinorhizobium meliloti]MDW9709764.1 TIGR04255 family protein [Sinorhizobium meliloti]MDW9748063.1 TIGR04255 family protein [Sinorhizobium meliloti]